MRPVIRQVTIKLQQKNRSMPSDIITPTFDDNTLRFHSTLGYISPLEFETFLKNEPHLQN